jgi:hypothetical protein
MGELRKTQPCNLRAIANCDLMRFRGQRRMSESTIDWARQEAARLRQLASSPDVNKVPILNMTARARQFFSDHAAGTIFEKVAVSSLSGYNHPTRPLNTIAFQLDEWAIYEEGGIGREKPFDVQFRIEAATDIMDQAQQLLSDKTVHVAAPVMLAGAALEEFLRSMQIDCGEPIVGKAGISAYAEALRKADLLTRGEVKDITAWADLRNEAAHGHFDDLSRDRTLLMVDGINLFISKHTDT